MKTLLSILIALNTIPLYGQATIQGTVTDKRNSPLIGANVFVLNTYDGTVTDANGRYELTTDQVGDLELQFSYLGYVSKTFKRQAQENIEINVSLSESAQSLDAVVVSASTFKAGDNSKVAVLKPMDIVTTAGSLADVVAAVKTLPGTSSNAEDGRLFVRGGEARETNIYVDGMRVFTPYTRTIGGTPTRGRFSPFLFRGITFSTGGYSSAYGQSLSGILDMNTIDSPNDTETNLNFMTIGGGFGHTQKWDKSSLSVSGQFVDLSLYNEIVPTRLNVENPFTSISGEAVYRYKTANGLLKSYLAGDISGFAIRAKDINRPSEDLIDIQNNNIYSNTTYTHTLNDETSIFAGVSIGYNDDNLNINKEQDLLNEFDGVHARVSARSILKDNLVLNAGIDHMHQSSSQQISENGQPLSRSLNHGLSAAFIESDYFFTKNLAIKTGLRAEYDHLTNEYNLDPRLTIAQKFSKTSQMSLAYGNFSQQVNPEFLFESSQLINERAQHFLINYNYKSDDQIVRLETYYKKYDNLIKYDTSNGNFENLSNEGTGYTYGVDFFWRKDNLLKNFNVWVSYSWLQNKRNYRGFVEEATPSFTTNHNLSLVTKTWINSLKSQLGVTYTFASGRPYENPNTEGFMNERSGNFHNLSLSWAYLISQQKIFFVSVSNAPNFQNEFGYRYASTPNENGIYEGERITPNDDQFFFAGFFITLSKDKTKNQLNNL